MSNKPFILHFGICDTVDTLQIRTIDAVKSQYTKPIDMPDLLGDDLDSAIRALITYLSAVSD